MGPDYIIGIIAGLITATVLGIQGAERLIGDGWGRKQRSDQRQAFGRAGRPLGLDGWPLRGHWRRRDVTVGGAPRAVEISMSLEPEGAAPLVGLSRPPTTGDAWILDRALQGMDIPRRDWVIRDGALCVTLDIPARALEDHLIRLSRMATRLDAVGAGLEETLRQRARRGSRHSAEDALILLERWYPESLEAARRDALEHVEPAVRLIAARALSHTPTLLELAICPDDDVAADVLSALPPDADPAVLRAALAHNLKRRDKARKTLALAAIAARQEAALLSDVAALADSDFPPWAAMVDTLVTLEDDGTEAILVRLLDTPGRSMAIDALSRMGTEHAFGALLARSTGTADPRADELLEEIAARLGADRVAELRRRAALGGALTLTSAGSGDLSLADRDAGALSLKTD